MRTLKQEKTAENSTGASGIIVQGLTGMTRRKDAPESGTPLVYIYLDRSGIESLYAQKTERLEIELVQIRSTEGRAKAGVAVGFGSLLTSLLGVKLGAETELERARGYIDEARTRLTVEHKLQQLPEYLTKTNICFGSLEDAASKCSVGEIVYVNGVEKFEAPDFYPGRGGVREINESRSMVFTADRSYDPSDEYFKKGTLNIVMAASLRNFTRLRDERMGATSHDAIMFRAFEGHRIPLGVFGYLMRHSDLAFQIKPYAIWLVGASAKRFAHS
jgi:hypothetical protein